MHERPQAIPEIRLVPVETPEAAARVAQAVDLVLRAYPYAPKAHGAEPAACAPTLTPATGGANNGSAGI